MDQPNAPERTALYRFFAADGTLLYVGITKRLGFRWAEHARRQPWWPLVDHQAQRWFSSRESAKAAEDSAIATEDPRFNIAGTSRKGQVLDEATGFPAGPKRAALRPCNDLPLMYHGDGWLWPYERVARDLESAIAAGKHAPGSMLPSEAEMMRQAGISRWALRRALALLRDKGTIFTVPHLGSFVTPAARLPETG